MLRPGPGPRAKRARSSWGSSQAELAFWLVSYNEPARPSRAEGWVSRPTCIILLSLSLDAWALSSAVVSKGFFTFSVAAWPIWFTFVLTSESCLLPQLENTQALRTERRPAAAEAGSGSSRPALSRAATLPRPTGRSATEPLEGGFAAMDRVGGGEKQLEDCTVAKSVISPLSLPVPLPL